MHELSVLMEVIRVVDEEADADGVDKVKAIVLQIGELSAVIPHFMQEYFPILTDEKPRYQDTELVIETIPGIARCQRCGTEYNVAQNEGWCPRCASFKKDLISGREFNIKEIVVDA